MKPRRSETYACLAPPSFPPPLSPSPPLPDSPSLLFPTGPGTTLTGQLLVKDLMQHPLTRRNPFHPVPRGYSLLFALELLAREEDLHRVPVVDSERKLINLITQVA